MTDLTAKTALVTGSTSGTGRATPWRSPPEARTSCEPGAMNNGPRTLFARIEQGGGSAAFRLMTLVIGSGQPPAPFPGRISRLQAKVKLPLTGRQPLPRNSLRQLQLNAIMS